MVISREHTMTKWQVVITKVHNGFVVDYMGGDYPRTETYQDRTADNDTCQDKTHIVEMLYQILESFGDIGSKHDEKRIWVTYAKNIEEVE